MSFYHQHYKLYTTCILYYMYEYTIHVYSFCTLVQYLYTLLAIKIQIR